MNREDIERFLGSIRSDETLRAEVERAILSDKLLQVPGQLASLTQAVASLADVVEQRGRRLDQIDRRLDQIDRRLDQIDRRLDQIDRRLDRVEGDVADLWGGEYERRARLNAPSILANASGRLRRVRVVDKADLADRLDDAVDAGRIAESERDDAILADIVATAVRRETGDPVWLVAEVSNRLDDHDVDRALRRADTLRRGLEVDAVAAVVTQARLDGVETGAVSVVTYRTAGAA